MNVSFTERQEKYIREQIASGHFQNASEVVRDALRLHETLREKMLDDLRKEINKAWDAPPSSRSAEQILADNKAKYGIK
ncbi:antitoxin ParD1/3/4 [Ekhidna lutea]|uniref:Antitoxin ParD1/3/4 n=1 Tax=Ekhidna lutea TaxID=447679 RepID=A0A239KMH0_EKHLU|nr:type II toxin-antitoxin system ParD family antitoxin [Ekhidna lutea]SNT18823.1 antitoxin ParD1/3/4 [Ekhidna lutea]